jgi:hypothetical protein
MADVARLQSVEYLSLPERLSKNPLIKRLFLSFFLIPLAMAGAGTENFSGEWAEKNLNGNSVFQLSLEQTGSEVSVFFSANRKDGGGAAPEADGKGKVTEGKVQFTWSDSFNNSGSGTIRRAGSDVILSLKPSHVADSRCLAFYSQNIRLKPAGKSK